MFFGFEKHNDGWREIVPAIFKKLPKYERRRFFLCQYNCCADNFEKIYTKIDLNNNSLFEVFKSQIFSNLANKNKNRLRPKSKIYFDPFSACIAYLFINEKYDLIYNLTSKKAVAPRLSFSKLIYRIFLGENYGILFDASMLFSQFVFERITKKNKHRNVYMQDDLIFIEENKECLLTIKLCFKEINREKIYLAKEEINEAWNLIGDKNINMLFLVFPKNSLFRKHIEIKNPTLANKAIKLVPYRI